MRVLIETEAGAAAGALENRILAQEIRNE